MREQSSEFIDGPGGWNKVRKLLTDAEPRASMIDDTPDEPVEMG